MLTTVKASQITLETSITPNYFNNTLETEITIASKGDESAFNIAPVLVVNDEEYNIQPTDQIAPGKSITLHQRINVRLTEGTYPVLLKISYADANGYIFQVIAATTFNIGDGTSSRLMIDADNIRISKAGNLVIHLKNEENSPIDGKIKYFLPSGLSSQESEELIYLHPGGDLKLNLFIKKESALPGSTYYLYLVGGYDIDGEHYTQISPVMITVPLDMGDYTPLISKLIVVVFVILLAIYIYYKIRFKS